MKKSDFPSYAAEQQHMVRDLLADMHKTKDTEDIDKTKKYTFSIKSETQLREQKAHEEMMFNKLKPLDDFIRPDDATSPRNTGYEHGHIRSLFKLDTYGPANSVIVAAERESGKLPLPNVDRYARLSPAHKLTLRSDLHSAGSSRSSTSHSTRSYLTSAGGDNFPATASPNNTMRNLFHSSSRLQTPAELTIPSSLRKSTDVLSNTRLTNQDRVRLDPLVRRKTWFKTYTDRKKVKLHNFIV